MSTKISIDNFQSISHADIDVDGFTILVGESSQGKSACLRAVNAACNNKFRQNYLKYGTEELSVSIAYDDTSSFTTTKCGKGSPSYELNGTPYEKLNRTVPQEIVDYNNFGVIDYYEQKYPLNFFSQFSKPLLLEFSQKRILEILSSSKAYDDMTKANSSLNKHKEQNTGAFKQVNTMLDSNKAKLSELREQDDKLMDNINTLNGLMGEESGKQAVLSHADELSELIQENDTSELRLSVCERFTSLVERGYDLSDKMNMIGTLQSVIDSDTTTRVGELEHKLGLCEHVKELNAQIQDKHLSKLKELQDTIESYTTAQNSLVSKEKVLGDTFTILERKRSLESLKMRYDKLGVLNDTISGYSETRNSIAQKSRIVTERICPVCGNRVG